MSHKIFQARHKVRGFECDYYGHVNNAIYLNYLEFARSEALEEAGLLLKDRKAAGTIVVLKEITLRYKFPAVFGDILRIETRLKSYGRTSGVFFQQIFRENDDKLIAEAEVVWVVVNPEMRPMRIPEHIISPFLGEKSGEPS